MNEELREKMRQLALCRSPEVEARRISALRIAQAKPENREKHKKLWENPEFRERVTRAARGRRHSPETRQKMSRIQKEVSKRPSLIKKKRKIYDSKEFRDKISKSSTERWKDPEYKKRVSASIKIAYQNPDVRAKVSGENSNFFRTGKGRQEYPREFNSALKETIRRRDDYMCQMPDCYALQSGKAFPVHHIDHNRNNNIESNLITLCPRCHVETTLGDRDYFETLLTELQIMRGIISSPPSICSGEFPIYFSQG